MEKLNASLELGHVDSTKYKIYQATHNYAQGKLSSPLTNLPL